MQGYGLLEGNKEVEIHGGLPTILSSGVVKSLVRF